MHYLHECVEIEDKISAFVFPLSHVCEANAVTMVRITQAVHAGLTMLRLAVVSAPRAVGARCVAIIGSPVNGGSRRKQRSLGAEGLQAMRLPTFALS